MIRRTYRRPPAYRRHDPAAIRGEDQMWRNLAALYARHGADQEAETADAAERQRDDAMTQERIRCAWLER
jgi:hypothetical protein